MFRTPIGTVKRGNVAQSVSATKVTITLIGF